MQLAEILIIAGLVIWQLVVFFRNRTLISRVAAMYPERFRIQTGQTETVHALISEEGQKNIEPKFAQLIKDTNEYLTNNKGAAADFNILKDISERHTEALDEEIQAQVSMPLYLGLLGTFLGAMFGLASLLLGGESTPKPGTDTTFIGNDQILAFLGGIGIAMVGSFIGLGLTLWANQLLKTARARRDKLKNAYYTFLQVNLLPKLNSDMQKSMGDMKAVLDTFNEKFFTRIQDDFFAKLSQILPLMDKMGDNITKTSENITVQRDFLVKLEEVGITKMANATIKIFDKVEQSAATFEKFMGYQAALNHTVQTGAAALTTMHDLLTRVNNIEKAAEQLPIFVNEHGAALRQMLNFFQAHERTLADLKARMEQQVDLGARSLEQIVERRIQEMEAEYQQADDKLRQYFASLNDQNIYDKVVRYLQPFSDLPKEQGKLTTEQTSQNKRLTDLLQRLDQRLSADEQIQQTLTAEVARLARAEEELARRGLVGKLFGSKKTPAASPNGYPQ